MKIVFNKIFFKIDYNKYKNIYIYIFLLQKFAEKFFFEYFYNAFKRFYKYLEKLSYNPEKTEDKQGLVIKDPQRSYKVYAAREQRHCKFQFVKSACWQFAGR